MRTVNVNFDELQTLLFWVYDRDNISTEKAAEMLNITVFDFIKAFNIWVQGE